MAPDLQGVIRPGGTIGIVGGGQLGRMTALAAARLGYRCHFFSPEADCPAAQVSPLLTVARYDDHAALARFAAAVDVVTFEFENVPAASVRVLSDAVPVRPHWHILWTSQDRAREKSFFNSLGIETAPWREVPDRTALDAAVADLGRPAILKSACFGYDGKGQSMVDDGADLDAAWTAIGARAAILEGKVDFAIEVSAIVARGLDGRTACFDIVENRHKHGILDVTVAPAAIPPALAAQAMSIARRAATALDLVGLLAVEMFVTRDGRLLVNEMAPRPHNSGHWTIDACPTSQFEQFVRAVCGLPLGDARRHSDAEMTNLIGKDIERVPDLLAAPGVRLHLYGKTAVRAGRKMGHITRLRPVSGVGEVVSRD